jgi:hydroxymethylbilane synthase
MDRTTTAVLGTRGSPLALWQARHVAARLERANPGLAVELAIIKTEGDRVTDRPFGDMPGRGFFVKEIEDALLDRRIDLAVHSLKDLPTEQPPGLAIAAVLERHDPRDALLSVEGWSFAEVPAGTMVATGSPRRRSQLLHARPDLGACLVRGNVDTRIRKLREGRFGAMVLALAGVERLGIREVPVRPLPIDVCLPAVGQGAVAVEARDDDDATRGRVSSLTHDDTLRCARAERAFLGRLGGGCLAPATAHARIVEGRIFLDAMVGDPDGRRLLRSHAEGLPEEGSKLAEELADRLLAAGGDSILRDARLPAPGGPAPTA